MCNAGPGGQASARAARRPADSVNLPLSSGLGTSGLARCTGEWRKLPPTAGPGEWQVVLSRRIAHSALLCCAQSPLIVRPSLSLQVALAPGVVPRALQPHWLQPRASYVSLSGLFIPRQVGRRLGKAEMATSPPREVIHFTGEV